MSPDEIKEEAAREWRLAFDDAMRPCQYDTNFADFISKREAQAEHEVTQSLQPWLHILEDGIQWLANLASILDELNSAERLSNADRSTWALVGASCAHAAAVRRLVLSGLDTPARAAARTLDEHLCACITFLHDRSLSEQFQQCQNSNEIDNFWYKNLNGKALKKHLNAVERSVGLEPLISVDMRAWREREIGSFSQAIHPSYLGASLTTLTLSARDPDVYGLAFLGMASAMSERTLAFACMSIWYFCCFGFMMLFNEHQGQPAVIELKKDDERHQVVVVGRHVLQILTKRYWNHEVYRHSET